MTKITIIDIDLGESIEDIINDDVKKLTEDNQKDIDKAIAASKESQKAKQQKANNSKLQEQKYTIVLAQVYDLMVDNRNRNLTTSIDKMLEITNGVIDSPTSLAMRLKSYIKEHHDNEYVMTKCKRGGKTHYDLAPYNKD